ncbi:glucoamylase family protein [Botrimarina hoheduenensis]|uniref:Glycoamylase-like domain-containing protein n=1 Tax=Botrimarina hoheduenensis TaxID=2528000 RepID=A0A5C5WAK9_9BACT|nr:glucoamylase family protein [Botrimarina hoheduenensis]TWT47547.1 hypothetical protein Pla111_11620 [Botrimarina hoheduenensis]
MDAAPAVSTTDETRIKSRQRGTRRWFAVVVIGVGVLVSTACVPLHAADLAAQPASSAVNQHAPFLDDLQERTFGFFWETTPAENGLTPDRWPTKTASSIAAVGFGLTSYGVGVERGWITRDEARARTLATLRFFAASKQSPEPHHVSGHRGFYYHFLLADTGERWRQCELSSIDTALLMLGVLYAREYFDDDTAEEVEIRRLADFLYERVEWSWMQPRPPLVAMAWHPEQQAFGGADYRGYNEALFLYVLALGSPTHPIDPAAWDRFTAEYDWAPFYGQEHANFAPLFGHQYAACWIDLRGVKDGAMRERGLDYFENSRRATLAQRAYAIENPQGWRDYGADIWGLTACDGPGVGERVYRGKQHRFASYWARGAAAPRIDDDGTIAPTAAGGSIPFAPEETLRALQTMRDRYGDALYGQYGFRDSFNPSLDQTVGPAPRNGKMVEGLGWFNTDYLGIDQGPILLMAENYRTGSVWEVMRRSEPIRRGLQRAGFTGGWLEPTEP